MNNNSIRVHLLFLIVCLFQTAQTTTTLVIDSFTVSQPALFLISSTSFPSISSGTEETATSGILANERDLQLTLTSGNTNVVATANINSGSFTTSIGKGGEGFALLQYDGIDGSIDLNTTGLTSLPGSSLGLNLLSNDGAKFNMTYKSNYEIMGSVYVYDVISGVCSQSLIFSATDNEISTIFFSFDKLEGFCDLSKVGAIEFFFTVAVFNEFSLYEITIISSPPSSPPSSCVLMIDDFTVSQTVLSIEANYYAPFPFASSNYQDDSSLVHILGGERDIQITIQSGSYYNNATAGVNHYQFSYNSIKDLIGYSSIQYDGMDGSMNVNVTGLTAIPGASNGLDLTNFNGNAFNITFLTSYQFGMDIYVYSIYGDVCVNYLLLDVSDKPSSVQIPFSDFGELMGNCNFQQVGAIQLFIDSIGSLYLQIFQFCVVS